MSVLRKVAGIWLCALCLCAGLVLVSGWTNSSQAFATGSVMNDPVGKGDFDPTAGDPDGPDDGPPSTAGQITHDGSLSSGISSGVQQPSVAITGTPARRGGAWAHWMIAFKLALRTAFVVH